MDHLNKVFEQCMIELNENIDSLVNSLTKHQSAINKSFNSIDSRLQKIDISLSNYGNHLIAKLEEFEKSAIEIKEKINETKTLYRC